MQNKMKEYIAIALVRRNIFGIANSIIKIIAEDICKRGAELVEQPFKRIGGFESKLPPYIGCITEHGIIEGMVENKTGNCYDCGLEYGKPGWVEAIIPDKAWNLIRPDDCGKGCGILCIGCMSQRLVERGLSDVPVWLCGTEPLRAMMGDPGDTLDILRNWGPKNDAL